LVELRGLAFSAWLGLGWERTRGSGGAEGTRILGVVGIGMGENEGEWWS